jgi:hypothetical protein
LAAVDVRDGEVRSDTTSPTDTNPYDDAAALLRESVDVDALLSAASLRVNYWHIGHNGY